MIGVERIISSPENLQQPLIHFKKKSDDIISQVAQSNLKKSTENQINVGISSRVEKISQKSLESPDRQKMYFLENLKKGVDNLATKDDSEKKQTELLEGYFEQIEKDSHFEKVHDSSFENPHTLYQKSVEKIAQYSLLIFALLCECFSYSSGLIKNSFKFTVDVALCSFTLVRNFVFIKELNLNICIPPLYFKNQK
jgi:hypothetical protein